MDPIRDYAIIGNCRSAALVSRSGSIDWLCWPRFDSPSVFAALLDDDGGRWRIAPRAPFRSERLYLPGMNVLETRLQSNAGTVVLTDLMPVASEEDKHRLIAPDHEILRRVECERGEPKIEMIFDPRHRYGARPARLRDAGKLGLRVETDVGLLVLRSDMPIDILSDGRAHARVRLRARDVRYLSLTFADEWPAALPALGEPSRESIARSVAWWSDGHRG